jgi:NhaP-type Na+/H+ or K+/H+ antiporter
VGTIGQRKIGRTGDGDPSRSGKNVRMRSLGFLSERQRRVAWVAFLLAAFQAPLAAKLIHDASWFFAVVVAGLVAIVIIADDASRRRQPEPAE